MVPAEEASAEAETKELAAETGHSGGFLAGGRDGTRLVPSGGSGRRVWVRLAREAECFNAGPVLGAVLCTSLVQKPAGGPVVSGYEAVASEALAHSI